MKSRSRTSAPLEFVGRSGTLKVTGVKGDTSIRMEQGGEVTASRLTGSVDVEGRNCDIRLDDLSTTTGPVRVNVNGGSLKIRGLKSDTRIDSRNAEVEVTMAAPAPVAIYSNGERVSLTPPPGGYTLDARVTDGRVTPDDFIKSMGFTSTKPGDSQQCGVRCHQGRRTDDQHPRHQRGLHHAHAGRQAED